MSSHRSPSDSKRLLWMFSTRVFMIYVFSVYLYTLYSCPCFWWTLTGRRCCVDLSGLCCCCLFAVVREVCGAGGWTHGQCCTGAWTSHWERRKKERPTFLNPCCIVLSYNHILDFSKINLNACQEMTRKLWTLVFQGRLCKEGALAISKDSLHICYIHISILRNDFKCNQGMIKKYCLG